MTSFSWILPALAISFFSEAVMTYERPTLYLEIEVFRFSGARFTDANVTGMIQRTNRKLQAAGIEVVQKGKIVDIPSDRLASITEQNVEFILQNFGSLRGLRLFLVKEDLAYHNGSWTYDPVEHDGDSSHWEGAIFITEDWAVNTDDIYQQRGYLSSNDSLLHELGHVLMKEADHFDHPKRPNFFHAKAHLSDDTMTSRQAEKMRQHHFLKTTRPK